ncbi:transcription factor adf-1 [Plakobranchus ocellatus]|uniref:Transcription factor adf-1 n=1 Tax=Plakobranchus ocellatus TaxID=259542 RepID=A0AAV4CD11_9GAST|nr:transcription factor adf-1 [Plakobranchus ocellatus]
MDDYKKEVIELVTDRPLLWDPKNPEYHNKDQRKPVWEYIDSKCLPAGTKTNSKAIWESLSRSFSNALRRKKNNPSGSDAGSDKDWKFKKDLMFLLPVKTLRQTSGNLPGPDLDTTSSENSFSFQFEPEDVGENSSQGDTQVESTTGIPKEVVSSMQEHERKRKAVPNIEHDDTITTVLEMMKQRQAEKSKESPRLNFFRALMPSADNVNEEQFLNFQMDVIQALQR